MILKTINLISAFFLAGPVFAVVQQPTDTGAGVLLIEQYGGKNKRPALILFKGTKSGKFEEPGGKRDKKEDLRKTASRELQEESSNLFSISGNKFRDAQAVKIKNTYICYALYIQGSKMRNGSLISKMQYHTNKKQLAKHKAPYSWKETSDITHVYIDQLVKDKAYIARNRLVTTDVNGKKVVIEGRAVACIRECINQKALQNALSQSPVKLTSRKSTVGFKAGTASYCA
jgi:hypothetical protein